MNHYRVWGIAAVLLAGAPAGFPQERSGMTLRVTEALAHGGRTVRLVCFGDSITGVYYHTGGRRAWPEMLGIALQRLYPAARIEVTNAGISGDTTAGGLGRIEADVLKHAPDLVVVMFGMNDVTRVPPDAYRANLRQIVDRCRAGGAEVILCTPNSIHDGDPARPASKLASYADLVREVGGEAQVPVADCYAAYESIRARDARAWMMLMSETIHPNMRGHRVFAEEVAWVISGHRVSLRDVPPLLPGLPHCLERLDAGKPLRVTAMPPYDGLIGPALRRVRPQAQVEVKRWETAGLSLADIEDQAKARGWMGIQGAPPEARPDLVVIAVPAGATATDADDYYQRYSWVLNWSLSFGRLEWDCVALLPSVAQPELNHAEQTTEDLALEVVQGQDIPYLRRSPGDHTPTAVLLTRWLKQQTLTPPG